MLQGPHLKVGLGLLRKLLAQMKAYISNLCTYEAQRRFRRLLLLEENM